ncbi:MAG: ferrous iron transport protein B [Planctomycetia bacterium]|nr:ferrous iron transport protein B [Planctomycetia bacterium]
MRLALTGNPNCGKTTLFNRLTGSDQYVGNWPGVTVEKKEGRLHAAPDVIVTDLPGIYSLQPGSPEEAVSIRFLKDERPDVILNIIDGTDPERHLYLTTQLLELGIPVVIAMNMADLMHRRGIEIDVPGLSGELGCPVVAITASDGTGVSGLIRQIQETSRDPAAVTRLRPLRFSGEKTADHTTDTLDTVHVDPDCSDGVIAQRYRHIDEILSRCVHVPAPGVSLSERLDAVLLNRWLAIPCFMFVMGMVYYVSISSLGDFLNGWTNETFFGTWIFPWVREILVEWNTVEWLNRLIVDGILGGVGAVLGFVPQMAILFFFLSFLEDCGYMARVAFMMDRIFRSFGLSGKSVIPMLISSGCGAPGIMASRTIENESQRRLTIMTVTMIPCGAKLPIIALLAGSLAGNAWWVAPAIYFIGISAVFLSCLILRNYAGLRDENTPFLMELPVYHLPRWRNLAIHVWQRCRAFIVKAGTVIFVACAIIWCLSHFGRTQTGGFGLVTEEQSLLAWLGGQVAWIFAPLGFDSWKAVAATVSGLVAKENIVGSLGVFCGVPEATDGDPALWPAVRELFPNTVAVLAFLAFNLFCAPCVAAIGVIRREMQSTRWTLIAATFQTLFAYGVGFLVYQYGRLLTGESFSTGTFVAVLLTVLVIGTIWRSCQLSRAENRTSVTYISPRGRKSSDSDRTESCFRCAKCAGCAGDGKTCEHKSTENGENMEKHTHEN